MTQDPNYCDRCGEWLQRVGIPCPDGREGCAVFHFRRADCPCAKELRMPCAPGTHIPYQYVCVTTTPFELRWECLTCGTPLPKPEDLDPVETTEAGAGD